jgi:hypothetical protein
VLGSDVALAGAVSRKTAAIDAVNIWLWYIQVFVRR